MRLPNHSFDTRDLVRSMSVAQDGPEEVMDAEDYLQPQTIHTPDSLTDSLSVSEPRMNGKVPSVSMVCEYLHTQTVPTPDPLTDPVAHRGHHSSGARCMNGKLTSVSIWDNHSVSPVDSY